MLSVKTVLINMKVGLLFSICVLLLYGNISRIASKRSYKNAEDLIDNICDELLHEDLRSKENQRWEKLCMNWVKTVHHQRPSAEQDENTIDEISTKENHQPRLFGSRGGSGSRSVGSRSGGSSSRSGGGSRAPSPGTRYRSRSTGGNIIRPPESFWSRTRHAFLPISHRYFYRTRSSTNRYTTPATGSITYYYCSTNSSIPEEIQCSSSDGDMQCCEDETTGEVYCCGGKIDDDLIDDYNRATKLLARIFYTLSALALLTHLFRRWF